jgi:predicted lipid carrier protein YhbT
VGTDAPGEPWTLWTDDGVFSVSRSDGRVTADVTVRGSASDLLLLLWRRLPPDVVSLTVERDGRILDRWLRLGMP